MISSAALCLTLLLFSRVTFAVTEVTETNQAAIPARLAIHSLLVAGDQFNERMVVVGERGHILYSKDRGHNWQQAQAPTRVLLTNIHLHDDKLGWAVGHDATILKTEDGGAHWRKVFSNSDEQMPLLDIWFGDAGHGLAIGAYGQIYVSRDGGENWEQRRVNDDDDFHLNQISQADDGALYIAAEAGMVYRSDDEGETWLTLAPPYQGSFFGALPVDADTLFLYGLRGHLFLSNDRGESWRRIETPTTAMLTSAVKFNNQCIFIGLSGVLMVDDGCDGEALLLQQLPGREGLADILISDNHEVVLIGEHGVMRYAP